MIEQYVVPPFWSVEVNGFPEGYFIAQSDSIILFRVNLLFAFQRISELDITNYFQRMFSLGIILQIFLENLHESSRHFVKNMMSSIRQERW